MSVNHEGLCNSGQGACVLEDSYEWLLCSRSCGLGK